MPGTIYVPQQQNPWMNMIPDLIAQLAYAKVAQNFRQRALEQEQAAEDLRTTRAQTARQQELGAQLVLEGKAEQVPGSEVVREGPVASQVELGGNYYRPTSTAPVPLTIDGQVIGHYSPQSGMIHYLPGGGKTWGQPQTAGANDGTGLRPGTVYLTDPESGDIKVLQSPQETPQYTTQQKLDDIRATYNGRRQALATAAPTYDKGQLQPQFDILNSQEKTEMWRVLNGRKTALELGVGLDNFGYYPGEQRQAADGKTYEYVGYDQWQPAGQPKTPQGTGTPRPRGGYR
jgi:hypothetical protein